MEDQKKELPELIAYNEAAHKRAFKAIEAYSREVEKFKTDYEVFAKEVGLQPFSPDLLQEIITYGRTAIERRIDKLVLTMPKPLQKTYRDSYYGDLLKIDNALNAIKVGPAKDLPSALRQISALPWNGNSITPTEAYFKAIRKHFETWITLEVEKEVWRKYKAIAIAYNSFYELTDREGLRVPAGFTGLFGPYFGTAPREVKANPGLIFPLRNNCYESYENY